MTVSAVARRHRGSKFRPSSGRCGLGALCVMVGYTLLAGMLRAWPLHAASAVSVARRKSYLPQTDVKTDGASATGSLNAIAPPTAILARTHPEQDGMRSLRKSQEPDDARAAPHDLQLHLKATSAPAVRVRTPKPRDSRHSAVAAAQARYDKHFPHLDNPERFRSSSEVGQQVSRQQAERLTRGPRAPTPTRSQLRTATNRTGRPKSWGRRDRWWRGVLEAHSECELLRLHGVGDSVDASRVLNAKDLARWETLDCQAILLKSSSKATDQAHHGLTAV